MELGTGTGFVAAASCLPVARKTCWGRNQALSIQDALGLNESSRSAGVVPGMRVGAPYRIELEFFAQSCKTCGMKGSIDSMCCGKASPFSIDVDARRSFLTPRVTRDSTLFFFGPPRLDPFLTSATSPELSRRDLFLAAFYLVSRRCNCRLPAVDSSTWARRKTRHQSTQRCPFFQTEAAQTAMAIFSVSQLAVCSLHLSSVSSGLAYPR